MSIYISTCLERIDEANSLATRLRELGHEILSSWHHNPESTRASEARLGEEQRQKIALTNYSEILRSEFFVCIPDERCRGTLAEYGFALGGINYGARTRLVCIGDPSRLSLMASFWDEVCASESEFLSYLVRYARFRLPLASWFLSKDP